MAEKQTFGFQAEVKQLLQLMIHSLYSNKEIFLRELISNASDAADKLRFEALAKPELLEEDAELKIWVDFNKEARTLTIRDNGIGMTEAEVIQNLGTIARSGTKEFLENLSADKAQNAQLIGQFGVGFYSSFIVSDEVVVNTRRAGEPPEAGVRWRSKGEGDYEIESVLLPQRGTQIVLHLKSDEDEFLNDWQLKTIIKKYSDHINLPVVMKKEVFASDSETEDSKDVTPTPSIEEEVVNRASALWTQPKSEIDETQYIEFYKHIAHDYEAPLTWAHFKVEGKLEYTSILYVPSRAPFDLYHANKSRGLKLYVQRVFIMDEAEQFLPNYLRFVRGVVDSADLPLNVSRELLQNHRVVDTLRSALTKRVLGLLEQLSLDAEKYQKFWKEFGQVLKEGPAEDHSNREQIAKLLRFASTQSGEAQTVSLTDYIARMKEGQTKIYYLAAEGFNACQHSPHLEIFRKKGIEVLLLSDRIDEWLMSHLNEFDTKTIQSVARGGLDLKELGDSDEATHQEETQQAFEAVLVKAREVLQEQVKDVRLSSRLTESPACIVADDNAMTSQMERLLKSAGQAVTHQKPILELNPEHPMVVKLRDDAASAQFKDWIQLLLDQSILSEGGQLRDPASFVQRLNNLLLSQS